MTLQQALQLAIQHHDNGRLREAESLYRQILQHDPNQAEAWRMLGLLAHQVGRGADAVKLLQRAIELNPRASDYHSNLGVVLATLARHTEAVAEFQAALALRPNDPQTLTNLANAFQEQGQLPNAIELYRRAVSIQPSLPEAHYNLGKALQQAGDLATAAEAYRQALSLRVDYPDARFNLGTVFEQEGKLDDAIGVYRQTLATRPNHVDALYRLANLLSRRGGLSEAVALYRQVLALKPDHAEAMNNLGTALANAGRPRDAAEMFRQFLSHRPQSTEGLFNLGNALAGQDLLDEAITTYHQALGIDPGSPDVLYNLGNALMRQGRLDEAVDAYRRAIAVKPDYAKAYVHLAYPLRERAELADAVASFRQALAIEPHARAAGNLAFALQYDPDVTPRQLRDELAYWNDTFARPLAQFIPKHENDLDPDRRLRVGYVSPHLSTHVVGHYFLPLIANHDHTRFEIFCYSDTLRPDAMTERIRSHADHWRHTAGLLDEQFCQQVRQDRIDLLVDLTMHMDDNRMLAFARKPAPVQATWLGYPGSTGLQTMDYRLTDRYLDPPGTDESLYVEKTVRLPDCYWCYSPPEEAPAVGPLPADRNGYVTFGNLGNFTKVNPKVLDLWSAVLGAVPSSRLLMLVPGGAARDRLVGQFRERGVDPARLEFTDRLPRLAYLNLCNRIDLGLDSFPYNGHTTSLDSLWMGVPFVTLSGQTPVSRGGASILSNVGLGELIAPDADTYVRLARELAGDLSRVATLRSGLRERMRSSPVTDASRFARNMETAYRLMWRHWCEEKH